MPRRAVEVHAIPADLADSPDLRRCRAAVVEQAAKLFDDESRLASLSRRLDRDRHLDELAAEGRRLVHGVLVAERDLRVSLADLRIEVTRPDLDHVKVHRSSPAVMVTVPTDRHGHRLWQVQSGLRCQPSRARRRYVV